jgi:hypothetical protein
LAIKVTVIGQFKDYIPAGEGITQAGKLGRELIIYLGEGFP